jgi:AcrR family transcriptional regulator
MSKAKPDRRVQRTRQLLHTAMVELIVEKNYDKITVQDIIDRANVGRSTFYAHFMGKDDLLRDGISDLRIDLSQHFETREDTGILLRTTEVFRHLQEKHRLYRAMIGTEGVDFVKRVMRKQMSEDLAQRIEGDVRIIL